MFTGIDAGNYAIKIVQGTQAGPTFKLTRAVTIPIDPDGDRESTILTTLQTDLPGLKLGKSKFRMGVTGRDLMVRYTSVPPVPTWRVRMLMDFEVQDMSQSAGDPLTADYNILRGGGDTDETVLVALVKTAHLTRRLQAAESALKQPIYASTPNCIALFNAFLAFGDRHDGEYTFLLDIGDQNVEMAIQKDGELLFARNLSGGGESFTKAVREAWNVSTEKARELIRDLGNVAPRGKASYGSSAEEKVANAIIGEAGRLAGMVQSTISFARTQSGQKDLQIGRVLISGGGAALKGLDDYLAQNLKVPVQRFIPEAGIDTSGLPADEAEAFDAQPTAFISALGLARMSGDAEAFVIDIVPKEVKAKRRFVQRQLYMYLSGLILLLGLVLLWVDYRSELSTAVDLREKAKRAERKEVNVRRSYDEKVRRAADLADKYNVLAWESRAGTYLVRAQRAMQECAPSSLWLQSITVAKKPVLPPTADASDKKAAVEKVVVEVKGRLWGQDKMVLQTCNELVEKLRAHETKPWVSPKNMPERDGDEFELTLDFAGWPGQTPAPEGQQP